MANILYTEYNIQIHKKAAIYLINIDTDLYKWELQMERKPTGLT